MAGTIWECSLWDANSMSVLCSDHPAVDSESARSKSISVIVLRTPEEIEKFRLDWEALQSHPDNDIDFFLSLVKAREEVVRPHVLVVLTEGRAAAMAVAVIQHARIHCRVGYLYLLSFSACCISLMPHGVLGDQAYTPELITCLCEDRAKERADFVSFLHVRRDSLLGKELNRRRCGSRWQQVSTDVHWQLDLSDPAATLPKGLEKRLSKYTRKLLRDFGDQVAFKCFTSPEQVGVLLEDTETVASKTYHRRLGVGFKRNTEIECRLTLAASKGCLLANVLYINEKPIAFSICILYRETLYLENTGFLSDYAQYSPGSLVRLKVLRDCLARDDISIADFGPGDSEHKALLCNRKWDDDTFRAYRIAPHSLFLLCVSGFCATINRYVIGAAKSVGVKKGLKRTWRKWLARS